MNLCRLIVLLVGVALVLIAPLRADTLVIDPTLGPAKNGPSRGMKMTEVETRFGEPRARTGPIGKPPISTWAYSDFTVYFEHDTVLHAVAKKQQ